MKFTDEELLIIGRLLRDTVYDLYVGGDTSSDYFMQIESLQLRIVGDLGPEKTLAEEEII